MSPLSAALLRSVQGKLFGQCPELIDPGAGVSSFLLALSLKAIVRGLQQLITDVLNLRQVHFQRQERATPTVVSSPRRSSTLAGSARKASAIRSNRMPERVFQSRHIERHFSCLGITQEISDAIEIQLFAPQ